jgi:hypothetical protein
MGSTVRSLTNEVESEASSLATIRWRNWLLADRWRWSWTIPASILLVGAAVTWLGGGWLLGLAAVVALALAMWQFLIPVTYEICALGLRRYALGRMRLVPWSAIHSYQLRTTGVIFYQRPDPTAVDLLSSMFVPYPIDEDEVVVALRLYLPHAVELP